MFPNSQKPLDAVFIAEKARALSLLADISVLAPVPYFPVLKNRLPQKNEIFNGLDVLHPQYLALPKFLFGCRWVTYFWQVKHSMEEYIRRCDIVNVEWIYPDCYVANMIAHRQNKKVVVTAHGNEAIAYFEKEPIKNKHIETLRKVDHIVAVSQDLKEKMRASYGLRESKISVIPNGVDPAKFTRLAPSDARKRLGLEGWNGKICVCVARLSEEKALDIMIRALALCNTDYKLYIVGDGPLKKALSKLVIKLQLSNRVFLIGPVPHEHIHLWLSAADFFCLSSSREGCPVVVHEALACGAPVVSTSVGGIPDIVKDQQHGVLCQPGSPQAFAQALAKASCFSWDRQAIAKYGQSFTWDSVAQSMVKIYKSVLSSVTQ